MKQRPLSLPPNGFAREEIDALRSIIIYIREELNISRGEISSNAAVSAIDIDNFITLRSTKEQKYEKIYKTQRPSNIFLFRLLSYVLKFDRSLFKANDVHKKIDELITTYIRESSLAINDPLFQFLKCISVSTGDSCQKICFSLSGNYYAYRLSSSRDKVVRSFVRVRKYNIYDRVPYFENIRRDADGNTRTTEGHIVDVNNQYIFVGFVKDISDSRVGLKLMIMDHTGYNRINTLSGIYLSIDKDGSYDFGAMIFEKMTDKFDDSRVGFVDLDKFDKTHLLSIDLSKCSTKSFDALISTKILPSSINLRPVSLLD